MPYRVPIVAKIDESLIIEPTFPQPDAVGLARKSPLKYQMSYYDFPLAGDTLHGHQHDLKTVHVTVVMKGSFKHTINGISETVTAPQIIDVAPELIHSFEALEDNSCILNIIKSTLTNASLQQSLNEISTLKIKTQALSDDLMIKLASVQTAINEFNDTTPVVIVPTP